MCIVILIIFKIVIFLLIKNETISIPVGGASDADYYDSYARNYTDFAVNIWPVILRKLHNLGLYSREIISHIFLILNLIVIPVLTCNLAGLSFKKEQKYYLSLFFIVILYPTPYFYTFDIYRDVFMIVVFLVGCILVKEHCKLYILFFIINYSWCFPSCFKAILRLWLPLKLIPMENKANKN